MHKLKVDSELEGWEELEEIANLDSAAAQNKIKVRTSKKTVMATTNLSNSIFSMQKVLGKRLDNLNESLNKASASADKQSRRMFWLTLALVIATFAQIMF